MILQINDDLDLYKIAQSGQCFRWTETAEDTYRIIAGSSCLYMTDMGAGRYDLSCAEDEYEGFWRDYLDLQENYESIRARIDPETDPFLYSAAEHEKGIRILRQDFWEMLVTFIISQNRNIPAIRRSVELLCAACGEKLTDIRGRAYFAFPSPEKTAELTERELADCRLGYRCRYVHAAAEMVCSGEIQGERLENAEEEDVMKKLTSITGVGLKVASCISLFGLHHIDAFPIDVWMKRILEEHYPDGYPFEKYSPYNGIYQQYMFAYYRHQAAAKPEKSGRRS